MAVILHCFGFFTNADSSAQETKPEQRGANVHGREVVKVVPSEATLPSPVTLQDKNRYFLRSADLLLEMDSTITAVKPLLIDFRSQRAFVDARIDGALNFPSTSVKTKNFYKQRRVVLVDSGRDDGPLIDEAASLAKTGFGSVRVLDGGIAAWRMVGGHVVGEKPADISWFKLTADEAHSLVSKSNWLIVGAGGAGSITVSSLFPNSLNVLFANGADSFLQVVAEALDTGKQVDRILVTDLSHDDFGKLLALRDSATKQLPLYFCWMGGSGEIR